LAVLKTVSEPPHLAQARSLERQEARIAREAAGRALDACLKPAWQQQDPKAAQLQQRIQGFGNFEPPPLQGSEAPSGVVDQVTGFVGNAVGDTIDDFREKGAVGAVRDGMADAADLILDGIAGVWGVLAGSNNAPPPVDDRICRPLDERGSAPATLGGYPANLGVHPGNFGNYPVGGVPLPGGAAFAPQVPVAKVAPPAPRPTSAYQGAFGSGAVGANYAISPNVLAPSPVQPPSFSVPAAAPATTSTTAPSEARAAAAAAAAAAAVASTQPPAPAELEDLIDFDDEPAAASNGGGQAVTLKNRGNAFVRQRNYRDAIKSYEASFACVQSEPADMLTSDGETHALCATLHANIALCYLRQKLYRRAVEAATASIGFDAKHAKAYYRRCKAYQALKLFDEAQKDLAVLQHCNHEMSDVELQKLSASLIAGLGSTNSTDV